MSRALEDLRRAADTAPAGSVLYLSPRALAYLLRKDGGTFDYARVSGPVEHGFVGVYRGCLVRITLDLPPGTGYAAPGPEPTLQRGSAVLALHAALLEMSSAQNVVGEHSMPGGLDPAREVRVRDERNDAGRFEEQIQIRIGCCGDPMTLRGNFSLREAGAPCTQLAYECLRCRRRISVVDQWPESRAEDHAAADAVP